MNRTNMVRKISYKVKNDFVCVDARSNRDEATKHEEELKLLEAWLEKPCIDDACIEIAAMNIEDNMDDIENENEIFMY